MRRVERGGGSAGTSDGTLFGFRSGGNLQTGEHWQVAAAPATAVTAGGTSDASVAPSPQPECPTSIKTKRMSGDMECESHAVVDLWITCPPSRHTCSCRLCGEPVRPGTLRIRRTTAPHSRVEHVECAAADVAGMNISLHGAESLPECLRLQAHHLFGAAAVAVQEADTDTILPQFEQPVLDPTQGLKCFDNISWSTLQQTAPTSIAVSEICHAGVAELWSSLADEIIDAHRVTDQVRYDRGWKAVFALSRLLFHSRTVRGGKMPR